MDEQVISMIRGNELILNADAISDMSDEEILAIVRHELMHAKLAKIVPPRKLCIASDVEMDRALSIIEDMIDTEQKSGFSTNSQKSVEDVYASISRNAQAEVKRYSENS